MEIQPLISGYSACRAERSTRDSGSAVLSQPVLPGAFPGRAARILLSKSVLLYWSAPVGLSETREAPKDSCTKKRCKILSERFSFFCALILIACGLFLFACKAQDKKPASRQNRQQGKANQDSGRPRVVAGLRNSGHFRHQPVVHLDGCGFSRLDFYGLVIGQDVLSRRPRQLLRIRCIRPHEARR